MGTSLLGHRRVEMLLYWIVAMTLCTAPSALSQNCANFTTQRPQDTVVAEGSEACLFCDYPDRNTEQWEKDTTSIRPGEPTDLCDCVASSGVQPVSLCFNSVSRDDIGDYTCVQQVGFGRALRCTVTLSLADAPQITNRPSDPNVTLSIGATRTIRVTYSQGSTPASVEWRKDGVLITGPAISTSSSETTLTLTNSGPEVRGRYNVTIFNTWGSDTFVYNVKVEFAPVINLTHSLTSNGFRLTCNAIAYPRVESVRWEAVDSGNVIPGSNDIVCQTESTTFDFCLTSTLDIESSSCDQAGYRCVVTNMPTISSQSISVCPTAPPPPLENITITVLNCTAVSVSWPVITTTVDSYIIQYRVAGTTSWNGIFYPRPPVIIPDLIQGVQYEFRGASINSFGMSASYSQIFQIGTPCTEVAGNRMQLGVFSLSTRPSDMKVDSSGQVFLATGSQLFRLDSTLVLQENMTLGSSMVRVALSSDERRVVVCLGDLSCAVYNTSDFAAGEQSTRVGASALPEELALFTAEEDSFYVGSILSGALPSMNLRQYGFGDRDFERSSDYSIQTGGFIRTFFGGFVNGANAYYFMADGDPRNVRGLRVLRTCDSSSFEALYELRIDCGSGTFPQGSVICGLSVLDSFAGSSGTTVVLARCNSGVSGRNRVCSFRLMDIDDRMSTYYTQCAGGTGEIQLAWDRNERECAGGFSAQSVCQFSPPLGNVEARFPDPGYPVAGSQLLDFGDTEITASAAITVDSTSIVYVGYTNSSGSFLGEFHITSSSFLLVPGSAFDTRNMTSPVRQLQWQSRLDYVYVATESSVLRIPLEECANFTDCESCISYNNPLCGWCTLEDKCSRRSQCQNTTEPLMRWTQESSQCISTVTRPPTPPPVTCPPTPPPVTCPPTPPPVTCPPTPPPVTCPPVVTYPPVVCPTEPLATPPPPPAQVRRVNVFYDEDEQTKVVVWDKPAGEVAVYSVRISYNHGSFGQLINQYRSTKNQWLELRLMNLPTQRPLWIEVRARNSGGRAPWSRRVELCMEEIVE